jgi:hypothetical protein
MPTLIPPTKVIRRAGAKKWHIRAGTDLSALCGVKWRSIFTAETGTVRTADKITCNDCLVAAISRGGAKQ